MEEDNYGKRDVYLVLLIYSVKVVDEPFAQRQRNVYLYIDIG